MGRRGLCNTTEATGKSQTVTHWETDQAKGQPERTEDELGNRKEPSVASRLFGSSRRSMNAVRRPAGRRRLRSSCAHAATREVGDKRRQDKSQNADAADTTGCHAGLHPRTLAQPHAPNSASGGGAQHRQSVNGGSVECNGKETGRRLAS
jgi:hypothetical protein